MTGDPANLFVWHCRTLNFLTLKKKAGNEEQMSGAVCSQCLHMG